MELYENPLWEERFQGIMNPGGLALLQDLIALSGLRAGMQILDLGCGFGHGAGYMHSAGYDVIGVDLSFYLIGKARKAYPHVFFAASSGEGLPFKDACFHGVLCQCSLSLMDHKKAVAECRRVLKPGGRLLISDLYDPQKYQGCLPPQEISIFMDNGFRQRHFADQSGWMKPFSEKVVWEFGGTGIHPGCVLGEKKGYYSLILEKSR